MKRYKCEIIDSESNTLYMADFDTIQERQVWIDHHMNAKTWDESFIVGETDQKDEVDEFKENEKDFKDLRKKLKAIKDVDLDVYDLAQVKVLLKDLLNLLVKKY